jgi:hypothetical protein
MNNHRLDLAGIKINPDIFEGSDELAVITHNLLPGKAPGKYTRHKKIMTLINI